MARRKLRATKVNTKLLMDIIFASLIVQKAPAFINQVIPLDPMVSKLAGAGAGYVTGMVANRPDISNASIALAVTDFINPIIDSVTSGIALPVTAGTGGSKTIPIKQYLDKTGVVADFINLNDYINNPGARQTVDQYADSY